MKKLTLVLVALLALGQWSGNQPDRDAVVAASQELGVTFERQFVDVGDVTLNVVFAGILLSAYDAFIPPDAARASGDWVEDFTLVEPGSGTHWVTGEEPERIGALMVEFFSPRNSPGPVSEP